MKAAWTVAGVLVLLLALARYPVNLRPIYGNLLAWWAPFVAWLWYLRWKRAPDVAPNDPDEDSRSALILWIGLVLFLISFASTLTDCFFLRWAETDARPGGLNAWVQRFFILSPPVAAVLVVVRRRRAWLLGLLLLLSMLICLRAFWVQTHGVALYRDDNSSFMYRLWVFGKTFPRVVFYDPHWNGGRQTSYLVPTGVVAPGVLLWPLWRWLPIHQVYTPALAFLFILATPGLAVGSVRMAGGSWSAAWCGGLLALGVSRGFFVWLLHFGTIGSCVSAVAIMPLCAALYRVLWLDRREPWLAVVLIGSAYLFLCWPLHVLLSVAVMLAILISAREWTWPKWRFLLGCGVALFLLYLPLLAATLFESDVQGMVGAQARRMSLLDKVWEAWSSLPNRLGGANPLLMFFGLGGLLAIRPAGVRRFYGTIALGLLFFTLLGEVWKPDMQLSRAVYALQFACVFPAAWWLGNILERASRRWAPVGASLLVLLGLGGQNIKKIYGNNSPAPYETINDNVREIYGWIRTHTPPDARILFAGATIHGFGGGHVAYLSALTGREMMACDYFHFSTRRVEYEYPPRAFRQNDPDVFRFMELYNVSHIITFYDRWARFFRKYPDQYEEVQYFDAPRPEYVFRVKHTLNSFFQGGGKVTADINRFDVQVDDPDQPVVLRYNWVKHLKADSPVELYPVRVADQINFIGVRPNGKSSFTIRFGKWL